MKKFLICIMLITASNLLASEKGTSINNASTFAPPIVGKIMEKINVNAYTYLKLKTNKDETWVAVPSTDLALGTAVEIMKPSPMMNFESPTLKRKFDRLYFGVLKSQADDITKARESKKQKSGL